MSGAASLEALIARHPELAGCRNEIAAALAALVRAFEAGHKLLLCGNGGSAADCEHIAGELLKGFEKKRPLSEEARSKLAAQGADGEGLAANLQASLPVIALTSHISFSTAFSNDVDPQMTFAQFVSALGRPGDVLLGITTSGTARNVVLAACAARALEMVTIGLSGRDGGRLAPLCDICIIAPGRTTAEIQESHVPIYHYLCREIEAYFFAK